MEILPNRDGIDQPLQQNEQLSDKKSEKSSTIDDLSEGDDEVFPHSDGDEIAAREEVANALDSAIKKDKNLILKLTRYTQSKMVRLLGKHSGRLQPDDIVSEAINRILEVDRKWRKNKVPKIENLIIMTIVSLIKIEAEKIKDPDNQLYNPIEAGLTDSAKLRKNKKPRIIPLFYTDRNNSGNDNTVADTEGYKCTGRHRIEDDFDFESLDEEDYISRLESELEDDELAFYVFQNRIDGNKSNIELAKESGVSVNDVVNAYKRLIRKVKKITGLNNI